MDRSSQHNYLVKSDLDDSIFPHENPIFMFIWVWTDIKMGFYREIWSRPSLFWWGSFAVPVDSNYERNPHFMKCDHAWTKLAQNTTNHKNKCWTFWVLCEIVISVSCRILLIKLFISLDVMPWTGHLIWCNTVEKCGKILCANLVHFLTHS